MGYGALVLNLILDLIKTVFMLWLIFTFSFRVWLKNCVVVQVLPWRSELLMLLSHLGTLLVPLIRWADCRWRGGWRWTKGLLYAIFHYHLFLICSITQPSVARLNPPKKTLKWIYFLCDSSLLFFSVLSCLEFLFPKAFKCFSRTFLGFQINTNEWVCSFHTRKLHAIFDQGH